MRAVRRLPWLLAPGLFGAGLCASPAGATPVYRGKVSLSGFYYTESDGIDPKNDPQKHLASLARLGYGDLRATVSLIRIAREKLDIHLDFRLRLTGDFNFENKFASIDDFKPDLYPGTSARGYLGGKEYDLREAYVTLRATESLRIQLGRFFVSEADNTKLDGVRVERSFGSHWVGSVFAGGYPNPYSRSLLSDYEPPCGHGVTSSRDGIPAKSSAQNTPTPEELATQRCSTDGAKLGLGAGAGARYSYQSLWGNVGVLGSFFLGPGDGGPVQIDPAPGVPMANNVAAAPWQNLLGPDGSLDRPRIFVSWLNSWRPAERVDLMSDLVVDVYGSGGPQLTRAVLLGTARLLDKDRLTLRVGYSHLSSLAIAMYLNRLVYNRRVGATLSAIGQSAVENNLTVLRTGRDEARITLDWRLVRRLGTFVEGRFRYRTLLGGGGDPDVFQQPIYKGATQNIAGDATVGLRDTGSIAGIRARLSYSAVFDFRATNHVITFDIGREFWRERIGATLSYVAAITRDKLANNDMVGCFTGGGSSSDPTSGPFYSCFGQRSGMTHELGLQGTVNPWRTLFFLFDYRLIATTTDGQNIAGTITPLPTILGHSILGRVEYRW
jgi:hypothetical protein